MVIFGWEATLERIKDGAREGSAYSYAMKIAKDKNYDLDKILDGSSNRLEVFKKIN